MAILIYDSVISGHHSEYISHLVDYIVNNNVEERFVFVVSDEISNRFPMIVNMSQDSENIVWDFIPKDVCAYFANSSLLNRSMLEYNAIQSYALKYEVTAVFLLHFNVFQFPLIFKRPKFIVSGILFLQFYRMEIKSWKDRLKYLRKYWITKFYSLNPKVRTVFVLNDSNTVSFLNQEFDTNIFEMLPDPVPVYEKEVGFDVYDYYHIDRRKKILLHPGAINPRKGTLEIVDAMNLLSEEDKEDYVVLIVGKANEDFSNILTTKIQFFSNQSIIFDNSFVSNERLKSLFVQSFAVIIPYKNPEASSGIVGHTIMNNKILITSSYGLIGELASKYHNSILLDNIDAKCIAQSILRLKDFEIKTSGFDRLKSATSNIFASKILNGKNFR